MSPTEERIDLAELDKPMVRLTSHDVEMLQLAAHLTHDSVEIEPARTLRSLADRIAKTL